MLLLGLVVLVLAGGGLHYVLLQKISAEGRAEAREDAQGNPERDEEFIPRYDLFGRLVGFDVYQGSTHRFEGLVE